MGKQRKVKVQPPKAVLKKVSHRGVTAIVQVPRICVSVKHESTEHEGGCDGASFGDVLVKASVNNKSRFHIAGKLRELADHIVDTVGDPMVDASITVLMRRPRK